MYNNFFLFETESFSKYVYDANTNTVHPVPNEMANEIMEQIYAADDNQLNQISADFNLHPFLRYVIIWRAKTDAFRNLAPQNKIVVEDLNAARKKHFHTSLPCDLILVTTEQCNLRCAYCVHDEDLYVNRRNHESNFMSWETTKKAIDLYLSMNSADNFKIYNNRALNIVFYGGEPLLNWPIVKKGIEYVRKQYQGPFELHVGLSTNMTLFELEWLPFLIENNVFLNVSLDGPRTEHDRYRYFPDGRPTFDTIMDKLNEIRKTDPQYYAGYIKVLVTLNGNSNLIDVVDFFNTNEHVPPIQMVSLLKDFETGKFHQIHPFDKDAYRQNMLNFKNNYFKRCVEGAIFARTDPYFAFAHDYNSTLFNSQHQLRNHKEWYTGICFPGRKLTVTPNGHIHICERISTSMPVGDVDIGINETRLKEYYNKFFDASENCSECWARNRCSICPAEVDCEGGFDFGDKCEKIRTNVGSGLSGLYSLLELQPDIFKSEYSFY